jgi:hypothetical protein
MTKTFHRWVIKEAKLVQGEFTAQMILDRILDKYGNSMYIGGTRLIGHILRRNGYDKTGNGFWVSKGESE